jgi:ketosteroid isomerase-like protein
MRERQLSETSMSERIHRAVNYAEITELFARYATYIDTRDWEALDQVFTDDATFDATSVGYPLLEGLDHIRRHMQNDARHPAAHLILNVMTEIDGDRATARSRLAALQHDGRLFTGEYQDQLTYTDAGWRVRRRVYNRLQQSSDPAIP